MSDLKPCPFCGGEVNWCDCGTDCPQITCPKCGQFDLVKAGETLEGAKQEAETTWNNRPFEQRLAEAESQLPKWHSASTPPAHSYWLYVVYVFDGCVHKGVGRYVNAAEPYWISASRDVIQVFQWMDYPLEVTGGVYG